MHRSVIDFVTVEFPDYVLLHKVLISKVIGLTLFFFSQEIGQ